MTANAENTYIIPVDAYGEFSEKIAKLNRKAVKLGCDPIVITLHGEFEVTKTHTYIYRQTEQRSHEYKVMAKIIELTGSAPKVEGFQFIARIEYLSDNKSVLFHTVPGSNVKIDDRFRTMKSWECEHCNMKRRRTDTFVVLETATGKQTQVGRQCLADFTGINNPEKAANAAASLTIYSDLHDDEERMWGSHFENTLDVNRVLALTSAYIGKFGWVPKSQGENAHPTAFQVDAHFNNFDKSEKEASFIKEMNEESEKPFHQERAKTVMAWLTDELADKAKSDYEMNLVTLATKDLCERRHLGIVCSAVAAYQRAMNQKIEYAERQKSLKGSKEIGTVGERLKGLKVTVRTVRSFEGNFGPTTLVKFVTEDGNLLTWFATGDRAFEAGEALTIDGTVKGYKVWEGITETQLKIVKVK